MKLNHYLLIVGSLCLFACTQPIANSLLVNFSSTCATDGTLSGCTNATTSAGDLEISANDSGVTQTKNLEDGDTFEVTGSCVDQGRKNNRIIVQVFAGEDETVDPYFDNTISDTCYASTNPMRSGLETVYINQSALLIGTSQSFTFTAAGGTGGNTFTLVTGSGSISAGGVYTSGAATGTDIIQVTDAAGSSARAVVTVLAGVSTPVATVDSHKCMTVTKGIGLVEDAGLPNERTYPQCHNGQFGFTVRLGKALVNATAGQPNNNYMIRYKLRTQEGTVQDSAWDKVVVARGLTTPVAAVTNVPSSNDCTVAASPARFNPAIFYTLTRTYTDILSTGVGTTTLISNQNTLNTTMGSSVFSWNDVGLVDGVTYNYTLTSTDLGSSYVTPLTAASTTMSCATKRIAITQTAGSTTGTCYMGLDASTTYNPYVTYEWGYSATNSGWIGADGKTNTGYIAAACGNTAVCTESGLTSGASYFFALRAKNTTTGEIGLWSLVYQCVVK